jgi:hypothetical protein
MCKRSMPMRWTKTCHPMPQAMEADEQRDVLGELEITARLMITGGEDKEEARMTRADRSLIRQCILDAAEHCVRREAHGAHARRAQCAAHRGQDPTLPEMRRVRLLEMADAMDMFCQGTDGEMFDRDGTPWPEADITWWISRPMPVRATTRSSRSRTSASSAR